MKYKFAEVFSVDEDYQILIKKEYDSEEDAPVIRVESCFEDVYPSFVLTFKSIDDRDTKFETLTQEQAELFFKNMKSMLMD